MIFHLRNEDEKKQKKVADNLLLERSGYWLFRNKTKFELDAVMAFSSIHLFMLKERHNTKLTNKDTVSILEQSVKIILNSVVLDPMVPVFNSASIKYFQEHSMALGFESLGWFSPISVKGKQKELNLLFPYGTWFKQQESTSTEFKRHQAYPFTSLIQRVMIKDFQSLINEGIVNDDKCDMNFNRVDTFVNDRLLFRRWDIIQRDIYFLSPVHYLLEQDQEIDFLLEHVFNNFEMGFKLPESEDIFQSMMVNFLEREEPLHLYHKKFIATQLTR